MHADTMATKPVFLESLTQTEPKGCCMVGGVNDLQLMPELHQQVATEHHGVHGHAAEQYMDA